MFSGGHSTSWFFCRLSPMSRAAYSPLPLPSLRRTVWTFVRCRTTTSAADFCRPVRIDRSTPSPDSRTNGRSPEVSSTAFRTQPPNLQPVPLMDMGFAVIRLLARHCMPQIRFLYIGSYVCSALLSDPPSPERPCASLLLHLHQVVEGTFTPELSNMPGTRNSKGQPGRTALLTTTVAGELCPCGGEGRKLLRGLGKFCEAGRHRKSGGTGRLERRPITVGLGLPTGAVGPAASGRIYQSGCHM
jgi:hypothetical protein